MPDELKHKLEELEKHAFTLIGLSDREKFHTGMLAFAIKYFWHRKRNRANLVEVLWGKETLKGEYNRPYDIEVDVENKSVDLLVSCGDKRCFAEVKFKTTLHSGQMKKYGDQLKKQNCEKNIKGVVLGLFEEDDVKEKSGFNSKCFPKMITSFFASNTKLLGGNGDDDLVLIRMWVDYLKLINQVQKEFVALKTSCIPDDWGDFSSGLDSIKLRGIFERYRLALVWKEMISSDFGPDFFPKAEACKNVLVGLFNSHGNAGLHMPIIVGAIKDGKIKYTYGLQWQGNILKLFLENHDEKEDAGRDECLKYLWKVLVVKFKCFLACDKDEHSIKLNKEGKFRSITIAEWPIFGDISEKREVLINMLNFLACETIKKNLERKLHVQTN